VHRAKRHDWERSLRQMLPCPVSLPWRCPRTPSNRTYQRDQPATPPPSTSPTWVPVPARWLKRPTREGTDVWSFHSASQLRLEPSRRQVLALPSPDNDLSGETNCRMENEGFGHRPSTCDRSFHPAPCTLFCAQHSGVTTSSAHTVAQSAKLCIGRRNQSVALHCNGPGELPFEHAQ